MAKTAGIDWASEAHEVCIDEEGAVIERFSAVHSEAGIADLARRLNNYGVEQVAIERPDGILIERLLGTGLKLIQIHPNQLKAARARYAVAHGKSDRFDAFVLAELARTDSHRFRPIEPDRDETTALRALTRSREDLVETRVKLGNQLRSQLEAFWPGALIFADIDSPISLAFINRYPSPVDAKGLGPKRMAAFLSRRGYSGRTEAGELCERIRRAPGGRTGEAETAARRAAVMGLVKALEVIASQIAELTKRIRTALDAHPDREIFRSLFRSPKTVVCPATLIAEIGDCRSRYPTEAALAADAGMSPVAIESGKLRVASFRRACDKRLRVAIATLADTTRHWHPWAKDVYRKARDRGQDHPHAIRTLGRAWIRVLWRCWQERVPYDPARHGNLRSLLEARQAEARVADHSRSVDRGRGLELRGVNFKAGTAIRAKPGGKSPLPAGARTAGG
jgi:transposase